MWQYLLRNVPLLAVIKITRSQLNTEIPRRFLHWRGGKRWEKQIIKEIKRGRRKEKQKQEPKWCLTPDWRFEIAKRDCGSSDYAIWVGHVDYT